MRVPSSYACQDLALRSSLAAARACVRPPAARRALISAGVGGRGLGIGRFQAIQVAIRAATVLIQAGCTVWPQKCRLNCRCIDGRGWFVAYFTATVPVGAVHGFADCSDRCARRVVVMFQHDFSFLGYRVCLGAVHSANQWSRFVISVIQIKRYMVEIVFFTKTCSVAGYSKLRHNKEVVGQRQVNQRAFCVGHDFLSFKQPSKIAGMNAL